MDYILETERLVLRNLSPKDAAFILELVNTEGWLKYVGDRNIHNEEDAVAYLVRGPMKSYDTHGSGLLRVELKNGGTPIGICGVFKRENAKHPDLGFAFLPEFSGQGYASEAAKGSLLYAKSLLNYPAVIAITKPDNARSIKLLEKLGFKNLNEEEEGVLKFIV